MKYALPVAVCLIVVLLLVSVVNTTGESLGLWGNDGRLVYILCHEDARGAMRCSSEPVLVKDR